MAIDAPRPPRDLDGEIALPATDVDDVGRREQVAERSRPRRPTTAGHELSTVAGVRTGMLVEVFPPHPQHLLHSRVVRANGRGLLRGRELRFQQGPKQAVTVVTGLRRQLVIGICAVAVLADEAGLLEHSQVTRDAGLREAEHAGELADVEPVLRQHTQEPEPRFVAQETEQRRRILHIYKSI